VEKENGAMRHIYFCLLACLISTCPALAQNKGNTPEAKKTTIDEKAIRALIVQLGDDSYAKREAASKALAAIGEPALELLGKAAKNDSDFETRTRAEDLIRAIGKATRIAITPDGLVAFTSGSGFLRAWDIQSAKQILVFGAIRRSSFWALSLSPDGKRVIAGGEDNLVRVFDRATGKELQQLAGHADQIRAALFLPNGKRAVTAAWDHSIRVWDLETGKETLTFDDVGESVRFLALGPDGKTLAAPHFVDRDNGPSQIRLWNLETGKVSLAMPRVPTAMTSLCYAPDGKTLLSGGFDGVLRLWDAASGKELKQIKGAPHRIECVAFTPDGRRIVAGADNPTPTLRLWDVATGKLVLESEEFGGGILHLVAMPNNRQCMTATRDGLIRLWEWKR
jgi:WD40 repeat protein